MKREKATLGQKLADWITKWAGSWTFIILFFIFLAVWIGLNTYYVFTAEPWDPYPFILLNLALSCLAAIQAPVILMSTNRAAEIDRKRAKQDYYVNRRAEREIKLIQRDVIEIKGALSKQPITEDVQKLNEDIRKIQQELDEVSFVFKH